MSLELLGHVELPGNLKPGGFDHAAVHCASGRLYVAHTANDALDVIDCVQNRYLHSIPNLTGVAGALVSDEQNLVFTSNRGENTVGIFAPDNEAGLAKVGVGIRPNGLAYDPGKDLLLAANVGDPDIPDSFTLSIVNVKERRMIASVRRARPDSMDSIRRASRIFLRKYRCPRANLGAGFRCTGSDCAHPYNSSFRTTWT